MEDFRYWSLSSKCFLDRGEKEEVKKARTNGCLCENFSDSFQEEIYIIIHTFVKKIFNLYKRSLQRDEFNSIYSCQTMKSKSIIN